jgi:hypothetical protein
MLGISSLKHKVVSKQRTIDTEKNEGGVVEYPKPPLSPRSRWMLETVEINRPTSLQLPAPLTDAELLWLSAHNESLTFEQTAGGLLIITPPTGSRGNRGEFNLAAQLVNWNDRTHFGEVRGISGGVLLPTGWPIPSRRVRHRGCRLGRGPREPD